MPDIYDEEYFEYGVKTGKSGYENYRWLPDRIYAEVRAVINLLGINPGDSVLDFGCAKGYWVKGFREYGIKAFGCDISDYAISRADESVKKYLTKKIPEREFDFIVSRNTLEHIEEHQLGNILKKFLGMTDTVFYTVPLIDPRTGDYVMQVPDVTHKIRWTNAQWMSFSEKCGWKYVANYPHIKGLHENFKNHQNAIGLYILKK